MSVIFQHEPIEEAKTCEDNSKCEENEYCERTPGKCDEPGVCHAKPTQCLDIYIPVCGCDGKTYSNECYAAMGGVSVLHPGRCKEEGCMNNEDCGQEKFCFFPEGKCSGTGLCTLRPLDCLMVYAPVCGCDMNTYSSPCEAYSKGVSILHPGKCL